MTDYEERSVTRETQRVETPPVADRYGTREPATNVRTTETAYRSSGPGGLATAARLITFAFGILQALLILRIILLVLIANQGNDVVSLILGVTDPFVEPFRGMFALDRVSGDSGSTLDVAALVALIGWTLIEALILAALRIFSRQPADVV